MGIHYLKLIFATQNTLTNTISMFVLIWSFKVSKKNHHGSLSGSFWYSWKGKSCLISMVWKHVHEVCCCSVTKSCPFLCYPMDCRTDFSVGSSGKEPSCQCRVKIKDNNKRDKRCGFNPWAGKIPWRKAWQTTPVFLLGESHGQGSLEGFQLWGYKRVGHDWSNLACTHA